MHREGRPGGGKRGSPLGSLRSEDTKSHTSWADLGSLREAAAHEGSEPFRGRCCRDRCLRCCRGALGFPLGALGGEKSVVFMEEKYTF